MEHIAKLRFEEMSGLKVKTCGLFIDKEYPYFAASPGLYLFVRNFLDIRLFEYKKYMADKPCIITMLILRSSRLVFFLIIRLFC